MITGDLDAELVSAARAIAPGADGLPAPAGSWRPAPDGDPAGYATPWPFELARRTGRQPAEIAAALAIALARAQWISAAEPTGAGYLTITVTGAALASVASRIAASGPACARSDLLRGTSAIARPWPDLAAAPTWRQAWREQADAMTAGLAEASGASITVSSGREHGAPAEPPDAGAQSPVRAAVDYFGADEIRYRLARTLPGRAGTPAWPASLRSGHPSGHYAAVRLAHAEAASTLRWAAELSLDRTAPGQPRSELLQTGPERDLLGLLSWLQIRVASAARRNRPAELPHYLEQVAAAWTACRLASPALPFGGAAAPRDPELTGARLLLADSVRAALAAGLTLAGISPTDRI